MKRSLILFAVAAAALWSASARAADTASSPVLAPLDAIYPDLEKLYLDLHQTPELSFHEEKTAAKMGERLRALGFDVTTGVGKTGVVGILRNGKGPTVMLRTDLDALPVEEQTGLPYASKVTTTDDAGDTVHVMHACGHDVHMTSWIGAATLLSRAKDRWRGTLMMVGQPAEEKGGGAAKMLADGLFTKFPKPDFAFAIHDSAQAPSGKVEYVPGYALANVDSVDITIYGKGGHGAYPHTTIDPIVIAARTILALQTIVGRENNPLDPAVVTVGSIHGGTKHNIIPDQVKLQLTVRSYKDDVRKRLLASIERIAKAEAAAAGAPKPPEVKVTDGTPATYNDPAVTKRVAAALSRGLGAANVSEGQPVMGGEDFSEFGRAGVPATILWVGAVEPKKYEASKAGGAALPSLHSSGFAPDREATIRTGVKTVTLAALELLGKP
ncbi:MAG TPA: amidohydrolase [Thermoanaerobaculia bacterium]|jgi:hippurate hydrolase|nr:amidohydrolase [Thermoanaerobaculia bacterium]